MKVIKQNLKTQIKQKNFNKGFTLIESVTSLLMVTLITGMLLLIVNVAKNTYIDLEKNAEGQVLSAILTNKIQDELRYSACATDSEFAADDSSSGKASAIFYSVNHGTAKCQIVGADLDQTDNLKSKRLYLVTENTVIVDGTEEKVYDYNPLIGNSSYVFDLGADVEITYNYQKNEYTVKLDICDSNRTIIPTTFTVKQLNN